MAMNPRDLQLRDGSRAPTNRSASTRNASSARSRWSGKALQQHEALSTALGGFGIAKVRTR